MKILTLTAENVKRLSVVEIDTHGSPVVILAGENEAGKSSVLDAIEMALRGKAAMPPQPIHAGQTNGRVVLDMGDIVVTRTLTPSGGNLTVRSKEGAAYASPQKMLDKLIGELTFDPMRFIDDMTPAEQADALRAVAGIDTKDLDATIASLYERRTECARDVKFTQGALEAVQVDPLPEGAAADFETATAQLEAAEAAWLDVRELETARTRLQTEFEGAKERVARAAALVAERNAAFTAAMDALEQAQKTADAASLACQQAQTDEAAARAHGNAVFTQLKGADEHYAAVTQTLPDRAAARQQLANAAAYTRVSEQQKRRAHVAEHLASLEATVTQLTTEIEAARTLKADALRAVTFPIEGLGLDDKGVTWNGLPFEQASTAIRVRVSVAIGLALNPNLKVILVRNGNDLGQKNLAAIAQMAADANAQVWIERIAGGDGLPTVVIEDGHVAGAPPPAAKPPAKKRNVRADVAAVREATAKVGPITTAGELLTADTHIINPQPFETGPIHGLPAFVGTEEDPLTFRPGVYLGIPRDEAGIAESVADALGADEAPEPAPAPPRPPTGIDDL
jgi:hypothetical protein